MANDTILSIDAISKTYASGHEALKDVSAAIRTGEILALLGPNGAGKTTLISIICGLVSPTAGKVTVGGHDIVRDYRAARRLIGLVPQEIVLEPFETVMDTVRFSRGLFSMPPDDDYLEKLLKRLSLWDKQKSTTKELSGGMKRRCLIAKALAHEPRVLFLDEPTAGVDVELRKDMWATVDKLRADGVTTILTTHYIEEAEAIADRVGVISNGRLLLVEEKTSLMQRLGRRQICITLTAPVGDARSKLAAHDLEISDDGLKLFHTYDDGGQGAAGSGVGALLADVQAAGLTIADLDTHQRSLEEIFVELVHNGNAG
ncbi:MAG: ABC transporter ATP-binding protein, partial [Pseudomonadota bacterium]